MNWKIPCEVELDAHFKNYSEYLSFRSFYTGFPVDRNRGKNIDPDDLSKELASFFSRTCPVAILLSGGMDSASLLPFLPAGSVAYTMYHEGSPDPESERAASYCRMLGFEHKRIAIRTDDYQQAIDPLILSKRMPLAPAEPVIYVGAMAIARDGFDAIVMGAGPDCLAGGMPKLRKKRHRRSFEKALHKKYLSPAEILQNPATIDHVLDDYTRSGKRFGRAYFDSDAFLQEVGIVRFAQENAVRAAGCNFIAPYTHFNIRFDRWKNRVRPKYVVQDLFRSIYGKKPPRKIGLQKPADWLQDYRPTADIFRDFDLSRLKYPQKFQVYSLERFHALREAHSGIQASEIRLT